MTKNLTWFQKEINKDKKEVEEAKKKFIKDILQISKEELSRGPLKLKKESIWKRILKKLKLL